MTNVTEQFNALVEEFTSKVNALLRGNDKASRHAAHPAEPSGASLVKVHFTGDRDGNTFAVCRPTSDRKRVRRADGSRERATMWKYTYEDATGTAPGARSWVGMLKTLDGHGRVATRVEVFRPEGAEVFDLT